jgi:glycerol-3-phosphate dehydrogenase
VNNIHNFSILKRNQHLNEIQQTVFDVFIVGGGITGAGIALDAASRGLKVLLIEQNDFASGTSSRSTKLVHGGLRYLEKLQFKFVADLGRERKILHENAAHNVIPTSVILPIVKGGQLNKGLTYLALWLYDRLACVKKEYRTRWISKQKLLEKYPYFETKGLKGAFVYNEYKTNDGRLVIETLKKATEYGAISLNYMLLSELLFTNGKVTGAKVTDTIMHHNIQVQSKIVINATGPWCEEFMKTYDSPMKKSLYPTKGIHIVFSKQRFPLNEAFYFDTLDKRMVFAIPRQDHVYVGTTDTPYNGELRHPVATDADISYLLAVVNHKFIGLNLVRHDVQSCWAGIRPLIRDTGKRPGEISRKEEVFESPTGLISITGGKLTGYRLMAKNLVDKLITKMDKPFVRCSSSHIRLSGSDWEFAPDTHKLIEIADRKFDEAKQAGISPIQFKKLFYRYGTNIDIIIEKAYEYRIQFENSELIWLKAELWYAVNYEMVTTLTDFCIYRTEMVLFESQYISTHLNFIADTLAEFLNWNIEGRKLHLTKFIELWKEYQN